MDATILRVDGVNLLMPRFVATWWPHHLTLDEFPTFCGAGRGLGDAVVPERMWGLPISAACYIHDFAWTLANSENEMRQGNVMFLQSMMAIILARSRFPLRQLRCYRAVTYFNAVETLGRECFWNSPDRDCWTPDPMNNPAVHELLALVGVELPKLEAGA